MMNVGCCGKECQGCGIAEKTTSTRRLEGKISSLNKNVKENKRS